MTTLTERLQNKLNWHRGVEWNFLDQNDWEAVDEWHARDAQLAEQVERAELFDALNAEWSVWNELGRELAEAGQMDQAREVAQHMKELELGMCENSVFDMTV